MIAPINDGGPAYPSHQACASWQCRKPSSGMTLRDVFAAAALQGMNLDGEFAYQTYALDAYNIADAMLKAREKAK